MSPRGSSKRKASAATTMEASAATTLDRDNPADVLKAYDQIIEKNKSLTAEVGEGEKALGRQLKEITKLKQEVEDKGQQAAQYHELYDQRAYAS